PFDHAVDLVGDAKVPADLSDESGCSDHLRTDVREPHVEKTPSYKAFSRDSDLSLTSSYRGEKLEAKTTGRLASGVRNAGPDMETARRLLDDILSEYGSRAPKAVACLEAGFEDAMAVMALPECYRRRLRSTN